MKSEAEPDFPTFPSPSERDLPPGRHLLLKEHLMTEIRQTETETETETSGAPEPAPRRRRAWLRPALVAGAVAAAVAAGVLVASPFGGGPAQAGPPSKETVKMLEDIADAARRSPAPKNVRDDQFVYIKSKVAYSSDEGLAPLHQREHWMSVDGKHTGLLHEPVNGHKNVRLEPELPLASSDSNYRNLEKLPTDPVNMLDWLNKVADEENNGKPFVTVGDITREALMPPEQAAALYLAAAKIPGVELVDDAVDAAGRHGVAIAHEDDGERTELIFDKKTKAYLGERSVLTEDKPFGKKGDLLADTAVLERKIVDKAGERP
ncbi:CU044_5270 family protein [Streptomyces flavofungini]|uniref:CU044_5270 family protein n=1 Tax=Streptomyces flavofungini TaxID=68200 RepID=UPI0025AF9797|nr:CU044_5270 family protein [Streptomyces flavofungini]WJV46955.1 CU044_5270 family protein [Streptomyces flavofungini]